MINSNDIGGIELIETDWDRSDKSPCNPCWVGVNDLGLFQCRDCLALFIGRSARKAVINCLQEEHGQGWAEEYVKLKEIRSLVRRKKFDQLVVVYCTYRDNEGGIQTDRYFYEKV